MTTYREPQATDTVPPTGVEDDKSDWKVVLQFFIVPLALVAVLVTVFFGLQVLRSSHPDPRTALYDLKTTGGFLMPWVGDPKRWQSGYDLSLLLRSAEGESGVPLQEMLDAFRDTRRTADLKLRRYLALALGRSGDGRSAPVLLEGLEDTDGETRLYCAWGLMRVGDARVLSALRRAAASDKDAGVRKMAVFALGQLGDRGAAVILREALTDLDADVRSNAAISLARIGDAGGEKLLIEILEGFTPDAAQAGEAAERERASRALNAIRGLALLKDDQARAVLSRAAMSGKSEEIRATARLALEAIDAEARGGLP
jgi:HEAT repeat protein